MSATAPSRGPRGVARRATLIAMVMLGGAWALAGCSTSLDVHTTQPPAPAVGKDELARVLTDELVRKTGQRPDSINCPADLPRTSGANVRCTLVQAGQQVGVVTATINNQGRISYDYDINAPAPTQPSPGPGR